MERHKCKLCFRSFSNGRALGGHMRSHMMNLPIPPPPPPSPWPAPAPAELGEEAESAPSPSPSRSQSNSEDDEKALYYGLRENPKRSIRLVDPEFSFAAPDSASVVILQDRESETESSKNPTRLRSKRTRRSSRADDYRHGYAHDQHFKAEPWAEPEPASSVSDTTTEEDVAFCLMMMSRDKWDKKRRQQEAFDNDEDERYDDKEDENEDDDDDEDEDDVFEEEQELVKSSRANSRNKYKCETCNKAFRSYQALGGHRASHKKIRLSNSSESNNNNNKSVMQSQRARESVVNAEVAAAAAAEKKVHECPVCFRVFSSGQALGGHKRSHVLAANGNNSPAKFQTAAKAKAAMVSPVVVVVDRKLNKLGESLIDLNLPAPDYDEHDENSQNEVSAVSDDEFVNPIMSNKGLKF